MGRFLQKYGIIFFFCSIMGGIVMADCMFAVAFTNKERGLAVEFSDDTKKLSILQADSEEAFLQKDLETFLNEYGKNISINISKPNSQNGVELYSNKVDCFPNENNELFGVWLREDEYDSWNKTKDELFYYKGGYYEVLGTYGIHMAEEEFVVNMQGEFSQNPQIAIKGVYYLDCGEDTNIVYGALCSEILSKNPYAQILVLEENAEGYLGLRLLESGDAMYYMLQMGLLFLLNFLNFGNIVTYWVNARNREIFVRKMVGGTRGRIFIDLAMPFAAVTGLFIVIGMLIGATFVGLNTKVTNEAIVFGITIAAMQWLLLVIFECVILWKYSNVSIIKLRKQT